LPTKATIIVHSIGTVNICKDNSTAFSRITVAKNGTVFAYIATAVNGWHAVLLENEIRLGTGGTSPKSNKNTPFKHHSPQTTLLDLGAMNYSL